MKKIFFILLLLPFLVNAQTDANYLRVRDSLRLNGKVVKGISNDSTSSSKDSTKLITEAAAKKYTAALVQSISLSGYHKSSYYDSVFLGLAAQAGYNKSNWDAAFSFANGFTIVTYYSTLDGRYFKLSDTAAALTNYRIAIYTNTNAISTHLSLINSLITDSAYQAGILAAHTTAIAGKEPTISTGSTNYFWSWDKTWRQIAYSQISSTPDLSVYETLAHKGAASGYAPLGSDSKIPSSYMPALALNNVWPVASQSAMLALSSAVVGDVAIRSDSSLTYVLKASDYTHAYNWVQLLFPTAPVLSVAGMIGNVTLTTSNVSEGTNLYYTSTRFTTDFNSKSTSNLSEGTNLYYTDTRARAAHSFTAGSGAYNSTTGVFTIPTNTSQLTNGANFIALTSLSSTVTAITYTNTTGVFSLTSGYQIPTTTQVSNWNALTTMTYPGAGIAVSTGSAWGSSITDNSSNWNTVVAKMDSVRVKNWGNWTFQPLGSYLIANQTITLSGVVTGSGTTAITTAIAAGAITNTMLANGAVANLSGTNTGDNAVNSLYSGLVSNATHTGDATGATVLTLATVNANTGSWGSASSVATFSVNGKGLITAASNTSIQITESQVTGLTTDLAAKSPLAGSSSIVTVGTLSAGSIPYSLLTGTPSLNYLPLGGGILTGDLQINSAKHIYLGNSSNTLFPYIINDGGDAIGFYNNSGNELFQMSTSSGISTIGRPLSTGALSGTTATWNVNDASIIDAVLIHGTNSAAYGGQIKWSDSWSGDGGKDRARILGDVPASNEGRLRLGVLKAGTMTDELIITSSISTFSGNILLPNNKALFWNSTSSDYIYGNSGTVTIGTANVDRFSVISTGITSYVNFVANAGMEVRLGNSIWLWSSANAGYNTITYTGSTIAFSGSITASSGFFNSDIRLKNVSQTTEFGMITYTWKDHRDDKIHFGYSAQAIQSIYPNQVNADAKGYLSINYVEVLVKEVDDLKRDVAYLKSKIK